VKHVSQKLKKEIEILQLKSYTYEKKINVIDEEINNMMVTKYEKHLTMKEHLRNEWRTEYDKEEIRSSQI